MERSDDLNELAAALAQAQSEIEDAARDAVNPHLHSKYADLKSVWDACRPALTKHGLSVLQMCEDDGDGSTVRLATMLLHKSGQWVKGSALLPLPKTDPQGYGSALTYARRYGLAAMVGVCPEDDDGHAASGQNQGRGRESRPPRRVDTRTGEVLGEPSPPPESQGDRKAAERTPPRPSAAGADADRARAAFFGDLKHLAPDLLGESQQQARHWLYGMLATKDKPLDPQGWDAAKWERLRGLLQNAVDQQKLGGLVRKAMDRAVSTSTLADDPFNDPQQAQPELPAQARGA